MQLFNRDIDVSNARKHLNSISEKEIIDCIDNLGSRFLYLELSKKEREKYEKKGRLEYFLENLLNSLRKEYDLDFICIFTKYSEKDIFGDTKYFFYGREEYSKNIIKNGIDFLRKNYPKVNDEWFSVEQLVFIESNNDCDGGNCNSYGVSHTDSYGSSSSHSCSKEDSKVYFNFNNENFCSSSNGSWSTGYSSSSTSIYESMKIAFEEGEYQHKEVIYTSADIIDRYLSYCVKNNIENKYIKKIKKRTKYYKKINLFGLNIEIKIQ